MLLVAKGNTPNELDLAGMFRGQFVGSVPSIWENKKAWPKHSGAIHGNPRQDLKKIWDRIFEPCRKLRIAAVGKNCIFQPRRTIRIAAEFKNAVFEFRRDS